MQDVRPLSASSPWRRTMGLGMRSEASKFSLTAFGLANSNSGIDFVRRLAAFLAKEPVGHMGAAQGRFAVEAVAREFADVSLCGYAADGSLADIEPVFDAKRPVAAGTASEVLPGILNAYNETRHVPEARRSRALAGRVRRPANREYQEAVDRILASICVSFEPAPLPLPERFAPPDFASRRGLGGSALTVICRQGGGGRGMDLWWNCHHAVLDGVPVQEMIERLEAEWGVIEPVTAPAASTPAVIRPCHADGEREGAVATGFYDFMPLTALRRELRQRGEAAPLAALLIWSLSHQPEFSGIGWRSGSKIGRAHV